MKLILECDFCSLVEQRERENNGPTFYIKRLDELGIILSRKLTVIGGFSGCFKTSFALNIVYNNAINLGLNCGFLSLEMDEDIILLELLIRHTQHSKFTGCYDKFTPIKVEQVYKNQLNDDEKTFLYKVVADDFKNNPNYGQIVVSGPADYVELSKGIPSVFRLSSFIEKLEHRLSCFPRNKPPLLNMLVIDYIQLFARFFSNEEQFQAVAQSTRFLKHWTQAYANNRGISIIVLSQLNRSSYLAAKEHIKNPRINELDKYKNLFDLTSISESSEIVNAADIVLAMYTDEKLKKEKRAIIQLLKNRFGETIEEGIEVLALPEVSFIGDFKHEDKNSPEYEEYMRNYIYNLLYGRLR